MSTASSAQVFNQWIISQCGKRTERVGQFAAAFRRDKTKWPNYVKLDRLLLHLTAQNVPPEALEAVKAAWAEWLQSREWNS
jgi:hypothetical protein